MNEPKSMGEYLALPESEKMRLAALPPVRSEPLLAVYERFKRLDSILVMVGDSDGTENTDPFHAAARDLWRAVKESLGHTANAHVEGFGNPSAG